MNEEEIFWAIKLVELQTERVLWAGSMQTVTIRKTRKLFENVEMARRARYLFLGSGWDPKRVKVVRVILRAKAAS